MGAVSEDLLKSLLIDNHSHQDHSGMIILTTFFPFHILLVLSFFFPSFN